MTQADILMGRCLCGGCTFELHGPHNWVGHCFCESCRKATASPITTWIGQENGLWAMTGDTPATYESRADVTRGFCTTCGTPLFYKSEKYPNEVHFYASLLDNPELVKPSSRYHEQEKLSWMHAI